MGDCEIVWQTDCTVETSAPRSFVWDFMTDVANWDDPPAKFALDGPFVDGACGTTTMPGQPPVHWVLCNVRPPETYTSVCQVDEATLSFVWRFEEIGEQAATLAQRIELSGAGAEEHVEAIKTGFGEHLQTGMERNAALIAAAYSAVNRGET